MGSDETWTSTEEGISVFFFAFSFLLALVLVLSVSSSCRAVTQSQSKFLNSLALSRNYSMIDQSWPSCSRKRAWFSSWQSYLVILSTYLLADEVVADDDAAADVAQSLLSFSPKIFFIALLPPIIFNSGYHLRRGTNNLLLDMLLFLGWRIGLCSPRTLFSTPDSPLLIRMHRDTGFGSCDCVDSILGDQGRSRGWLSSYHYRTLDIWGTHQCYRSRVDAGSLSIETRRSSSLLPGIWRERYERCGWSGLVQCLCQVCSTSEWRRQDGIGRRWIPHFLYGWLCRIALFGSALRRLGGTASQGCGYATDQTAWVEFIHYDYVCALSVGRNDSPERHCHYSVYGYCGASLRRTELVGKQTEENADVFFRLAAHLAETSIFLELGLSVAGLSGHGIFYWRFILWAFLACLVGRALNVYPITMFYNFSLRRPDFLVHLSPHHVPVGDVEMTENGDKAEEDNEAVGDLNGVSSMTLKSRRDQKIQPKTATMLWFAGLRGAVAYACAKSFPDTFHHQQEFMVATMVIVLLTVFLLGSTTELVLNALHIEVDVDEGEYMENITQDDPLTGLVHRLGTCTGSYDIRCGQIFLTSLPLS